jgi:Holliday junction resolvase RusA-like endonuclease
MVLLSAQNNNQNQIQSTKRDWVIPMAGKDKKNSVESILDMFYDDPQKQQEGEKRVADLIWDQKILQDRQRQQLQQKNYDRSAGAEQSIETSNPSGHSRHVIRSEPPMTRVKWEHITKTMDTFMGTYKQTSGDVRDIGVQGKCTECSSKKGICQTFRIYGPPIPWTIPKLAQGKTYMYDSQKRLKAGTGFEISRQYESLHEDGTLLEGVPLILCIGFAFKSSRHGKQSEGTPHYYKPDNSNCVAYIEDVCTGLLYKDDSQIAAIFTYKKYDSEYYTEFKITTIGD